MDLTIKTVKDLKNALQNLPDDAPLDIEFSFINFGYDETFFPDVIFLEDDGDRFVFGNWITKPEEIDRIKKFLEYVESETKEKRDKND